MVVVVVAAGPGQGKAGKTGPGQTKPRLGTTGKPAKPKQASFGVPEANFGVSEPKNLTDRSEKSERQERKT